MFISSSSRFSCLHSARRLLSLPCVSRPTIFGAINHRWPLGVLLGPTTTPPPHRCWIHSVDRHDVEKEQPMSYYERTVTFSNSLYKLYQDFLLYQNITSAYQTACTGHHAWTQRYHSLRDTSRRVPRHEGSVNDDIKETESAVALIVQSQQRTTYAPNLWIPYRAQELQYHYRQAIQKVTPVVLFCMIPIVGYLPMLLAILMPRQLLSYHFYNQYEILNYNQQQYQQRKEYYRTITLPLDVQQYIKEKLYQHPPSLPSNAMTTMTTTADDVVALYRFCCASMVDEDDDDGRTPPKDHDATTNTSSITTHSTPTKTQRSHLLQLRSYRRDSLVPLALATGIYSSMITDRTLQYIITAYGTPTFLLRYYLKTTVQQILRNDQLLLCEEYLASTGPSAASFVPCQMTRVELSHAALLRGLPPTPTEQIGPWLTEHLTIVVALLLQYTHEQNKLTSGHISTITDQDMEQIGLFLLHLPVIRNMMHPDQLTTH